MKGCIMYLLVFLALGVFGQKNSLLTGNQKIDSLLTQSKTHSDKGEFDLAIIKSEAAIELSIEVFGIHSNEYLKSYYRNAAILLKHDPESALNKFLYISNDLISKTELDSFFYSTVLNAIGNTYCDLNLYEKSLHFFDKSEQIRSRIYKNNDPKIYIPINGKATAYHGLGRLKEAEKLLNICKNSFDSSSIDFAYALVNLGNLYRDFGLYDAALLNYEAAQKRLFLLVGVSNDEKAKVIENISNIYGDLGLFKDALNFADKALRLKLIDYPDSLGLSIPSSERYAKFA